MEANINFVFRGAKFEFPNQYVSEIKFREINKPNSEIVLPSGIKRTIDYGYADTSKDVMKEDVIDALNDELDLIERNINQYIDFGLDEIILYLTFCYEGQFNWEFKPALLNRFSKLNITLALSVFEDK